MLTELDSIALDSGPDQRYCIYDIDLHMKYIDRITMKATDLRLKLSVFGFYFHEVMEDNPH